MDGEAVFLRKDVYVKDGGLDLAGRFHLKEEAVAARLGKAVGKSDFRKQGSVMHSRHGIGANWFGIF